MFKTGGGTMITHVDDVDECIIALVPQQLLPLHNAYDSDAGYQKNHRVMSQHRTVSNVPNLQHSFIQLQYQYAF
jgi:hypothetical protein